MAAVSQDFERAYGALVELVERVSCGELREEVMGEEVDEYLSQGCRGSSTLAEAAALALRYEIASEGLEGEPESIAGDMQSLRRVEAFLRPPAEAEPDGEEPAEIVEVALPEEFRRRMPGARGFRMGKLRIIFEAIPEGPPHGHLSVSHPARSPSYEELLRARDAPGGEAPNLWALVPKPGQTPGLRPNTVHLYVMPPEELLG